MRETTDLTSSECDHPRSLVRRIEDFLFGYDFFISYAWKFQADDGTERTDGRPYAVGLTDALEKEGYRCFLDSKDYRAGHKWPLVGRRALLKTSQLIVVVTHGAIKSEPVERELRGFSKTNRDIIPIDVEGILEVRKQSLKRGGCATTTSKVLEMLDPEIIFIPESPQRLPIGPSDEVLERIRSGFKVERQDRKRVRWLRRAVASFAFIAFVALLLLVIACWQYRVAEERRDVAQAQTLASQSMLLADQPGHSMQRAALYAAESLLRKPSVEADQVVRNALSRLLEPIVAVDHNDSVFGARSICFSPDGKYIASASGAWDALVIVSMATTGQEMARIRIQGDEKEGLPRNVRELSFLLDTNLLNIVTDGGDFEWNWASPGVLKNVAKETSRHKRSTSSRDGKFIATAGNDGSVDVRTAPDGKLVKVVRHRGEVKATCFSRDGSHFATQSLDGTSRVWETETGIEIARHLAHEYPTGLVFCDEDRLVATVVRNDDVRIWNSTTGEDVSRVHLDSEVNALAASPDGRFLATADGDGFARVWKVGTAEPRLRLHHEGQVDPRILTNRSADKLVTRSERGLIQLWNVADGESTNPFDGRGTSSAIAVDADINHIAATFGATTVVRSIGNTADMLTIERPVAVAKNLREADGNLTHVELKLRLPAATDRSALFDTTEFTESVPLAYLEKLSEDQTNDGRPRTVTREIRLIEKPIGAPDVAKAPPVELCRIALSGDGKTLAQSWGDQVWLWDIPSRERLARLSHGYELINRSHPPGMTKDIVEWANADVFSIVFSNDGRQVMTVTVGGHAYTETVNGLTVTPLGMLRVWDINTLEKGASGTLRLIDASKSRLKPDSKYLLTPNADGGVDVRSFPALEVTKSLSVQGKLDFIEFCASGSFVAIVSHSVTKEIETIGEGFRKSRYFVEIRDSSAWKQQGMISQDRPLSGVSFSPDEQYIVTADLSGQARVWDWRKSEEISRVVREGPVQIALFGGNGQFLITTTGRSGRVMVNTHSDEVVVSLWCHRDLLDALGNRVTRNLTKSEWNECLSGQRYRKTFAHLPDGDGK